MVSGDALSPIMKTTTTRVIAVLGAVALASCSHQPPPETQKIPVSATLRPDRSVSGRVFDEVNAYRSSQGARPLQRHAGLDRLAQQHCEYLRKHRGTFELSGRNVSHFGFEGRCLAARQMYQMENISENVAAANHPGGAPAKVLVGLWKGSKDHHKNMLDDWTHSGIGVVIDSDGTVFSTQLFSTVSYSQMMTRERFNRF